MSKKKTAPRHVSPAFGVVLLLAGCTTGDKNVTIQPTPDDAPIVCEVSRDNIPAGAKYNRRETPGPSGTILRTEEGYILPDGEFVHHGPLINYWESGGKKSEVFYVHGRRCGERRAWYQDGQDWSVGYYDSKGLDHGTWITWYPNGQEAQEFNVVHGSFHGPFLEWHTNGQLKRQFEYVNGKKQGMETFWDENGNKVKEREWHDGILQP